MGSNQTAGHDPDEITMEEFYRLLHISKRRAAWILQAGLVPCEDRGSRTWRYRIPRQEALSFQKKFQAHPERYSPPPGSFSSTAGKQKGPVPCVRREELTAALTVRWSALPELLDSAGVSVCTGYARSTVSSWVRIGKLPACRLRGRIAVAKCDLIAFLVGAGLVIPGGFTKAQKHDFPPV